MKQQIWIKCSVVLLLGVATGCGGVQKLAKTKPEVGVALPRRSADRKPVVDTVKAAPKVITYRKQDGSELFFAPIEVDSASGEKMMSVAIDEVIISARSRRNLVERNGKINLEYIVTVPEILQNQNWRLLVDPRLQKGADTVSLAPLVYTGARFRTMQQREYDQYKDYLSKIVDSSQYFARFGNKKAYRRYMGYVTAQYAKYTDAEARLAQLTPEQAACDPTVGWLSRRDRNRQYQLLRRYVQATDRNVKANATYATDSDEKFDYLSDYLRPRYRYGNVDVLPGGEVYTRVQGAYPEEGGRARESYIQALANQPGSVRRKVDRASREELPELVRQRLMYTELQAPYANDLLRDVSDSTLLADYNFRQDYARERIETLRSTDTAQVKQNLLNTALTRRNQQRIDDKPLAFKRFVQHPYLSNARIDSVIHRPDGKIDFYCNEEITADENTSKLYLFLNSMIEDRGGSHYSVQKSDTLTFNVASMTTFLDETTRYMQRIVLRDAEANARFFFTFPSGKSVLDDKMPENRAQIAAVRDLTRGLMTDPIYIIDSITLRATSSPEGDWRINERLARERAETLRRILVSEFKVLYDSLRISASYTLDEHGKQVLVGADNTLPDLPNLLRAKSLPEDWNELQQLIADDQMISASDKEAIYKIIKQVENPDSREWQIRMRHPKAYERMRNLLYPQMRAVDFRFNLHRRGMQQDTIYTTEVDSNYMHAVDLLKKRRYEEALRILRPYEDRNTALAYMSLGLDAAAYRILQAQPETATSPDMQYMLAILAARLNDEERAVQYFLRAVELRAGLKFRGNLDPELSQLIRRYGLFKEDFE